jgi:hypothetical protein
VRSRFALDYTTGEPVVNRRTGERIERPRYWCFIDHRGRVSPLFPVETPDHDFMPVDQRLVHRIATDVGHVTNNAQEMARLLEESERKREEAAEAERKERMRRFMENNKGAWRDAMENLKNGKINGPNQKRDPVLFSYDGQPIRSSSHNTIPMTAKERGIDTMED